MSLCVLTEGHSVQHASVGRRTDALVDDADAILHGAFSDITVQTHDEKGHEQTVDQVLGQARHNSHPVPGQVSGRTPEGHTQSSGKEAQSSYSEKKRFTSQFKSLVKHF